MKQKIKYIIFAVFLGLFIGFLYNHIVIPDSYKKELFCYKYSIKLPISKCINKTYVIHHKEALRLKIVSLYEGKTIVFNNRVLIPHKTKKYSRKLKNLFAKKYYSKPVDYVLIPEDIVNVGKNFLKVSFSANSHRGVTIKMENYRRNTNNQIFVLFKDSHIPYLKRSPIAYLYSVLIILFIFLFLLWRTKQHIYLKFIISLFPANVLFFLAYIIPVTLNLRLFVMSGYFWTVQAGSLALACFMFFCNYNKKIIIENAGKAYLTMAEIYAKLGKEFSAKSRRYKDDVTQAHISTQAHVSKIYAFVLTTIIIIIRCLRYLHLRVILPFWQWLKPRPFSDKCIILFTFLFITCALFLIANLEIAAKRLANVVYFLLCLIAIIEFVQLVRDKGR